MPQTRTVRQMEFGRYVQCVSGEESHLIAIENLFVLKMCSTRRRSMATTRIYCWALYEKHYTAANIPSARESDGEYQQTLHNDTTIHVHMLSGCMPNRERIRARRDNDRFLSHHGVFVFVCCTSQANKTVVPNHTRTL